MNSTQKESILFIVNPISGGKNKNGFENAIKQNLDSSKYIPVIKYSERPEHASELALEGKNAGIKKIIAVGGDGTVNEVGKSLIHSDVALGIIPFGSGNGLARHLNIPLTLHAAIKKLNNPVIQLQDAGSINNHYFFCTCGMGFDAHIGKIFASLKGRGFSGYIKAVLSEFANYKAQPYELKINGQTISEKAFLITFANASQYGNNAYIAPQASVTDGQLDVCILKPFPTWIMPALAMRVFSKSIHHSKYVITFRSKDEIVINRSADGPIHIDGEPYEMGTEIAVKIFPKAIHMIV